MSIERLPELTEPSSMPAAAAERRRIARELHDTLGYRLTISMVQLENAVELIGEEPRQARALVEAVRGYLGSGLEELRETLTTLREHEVVADGLQPSLERLIGEFATATGIAVRSRPLGGLPRLSDAQATAVYRTVQEALINSHKHGQAREIRIGLCSDDEAVVLTVADDGRRFAPVARVGYGLTGLEERAEALGGRLTVARPRGGGVLVTLRLPLEGEIDA